MGRETNPNKLPAGPKPAGLPLPKRPRRFHLTAGGRCIRFGQRGSSKWKFRLKEDLMQAVKLALGDEIMVGESSKAVKTFVREIIDRELKID